MNAITLRNLPPEVAMRIRRRAAERKISLNKAVASLLEEGGGHDSASSRGVVHDDLDHLIGCWSKREADAFDRALADMRRIDPDLWS